MKTKLVGAAALSLLVMLVTGVIHIDEASAAISWKTVFLMACLIPLGWAMDSSGAAAWLAGHSLEQLPDGFPLWLLQILIGLLTTAFSLAISHVGATILMVPIAINIALAAGGDPTAFALIVALSASNNLMTASNPVMSMVTGRSRSVAAAGSAIALAADKVVEKGQRIAALGQAHGGAQTQFVVLAFQGAAQGRCNARVVGVEQPIHHGQPQIVVTAVQGQQPRLQTAGGLVTALNTVASFNHSSARWTASVVSRRWRLDGVGSGPSEATTLRATSLAKVQLTPPVGLVIAGVGMAANSPCTCCSMAARSYSSPGLGTGSPSCRKICSKAEPGPNGVGPEDSSSEGVSSPSPGRFVMTTEPTPLTAANGEGR